MAANKHQTFQQQFDRGPTGGATGVVVAGAVQSVDSSPMLGALPITNSTGAVRHGGKQHDNHQPPAQSIAIQVQPSTSSEELHQHRFNYHHRHYAETRQVVDKNNNTNAPQAASINRCHHEAATRTLLFHHNNNNHHNESSSMDDGNSPHMDTTSDGHYSRGQPQYAQASTPPPNYHEIPGIVPAYQGRSSGPPPSYDDVVNPNAPPPSYQSLFGQVREARKTSNGLVDLLRQLFLILIGTLGCTMIIGFLLLIPITMILVGIVYVNECKAENIPTFLVVGGIVWIMKNVLNCYNQFKKDSSTLNRPPPRRSPISARAPSSIQSTGGDSPATVLIVGQQPSDINNNNIHTSSELSTTGANTTTPILSTTTTTTIPMATTRTRRDLEHSANRIRTPSLIGITSFKCESMLNYFLIVWFFAGCIVVYRIYEPDYDNPLSQSYCHRTVYLYAFWLITSAFIIMAIVLSCLCCLMASSLMNCNNGR